VARAGFEREVDRPLRPPPDQARLQGQVGLPGSSRDRADAGGDRGRLADADRRPGHGEGAEAPPGLGQPELAGDVDGQPAGVADEGDKRRGSPAGARCCRGERADREGGGGRGPASDRGVHADADPVDLLDARGRGGADLRPDNAVALSRLGRARDRNHDRSRSACSGGEAHRRRRDRGPGGQLVNGLGRCELEGAAGDRGRRSVEADLLRGGGRVGHRDPPEERGPWRDPVGDVGRRSRVDARRRGHVAQLDGDPVAGDLPGGGGASTRADAGGGHEHRHYGDNQEEASDDSHGPGSTIWAPHDGMPGQGRLCGIPGSATTANQVITGHAGPTRLARRGRTSPMGERSTASAVSSNGVGWALTITRCAPHSRAISGNEATG
jgi:hypothetical protein